MTTPPPLDSTWYATSALWGLLTQRERRRMAWVLVATLIATAFETAGVASILPFMVIVVDPDVLNRYPLLGRLALAVGAESWRAAVIWAAAGTGAIIAVANAARILGSWLQWRFEAQVRHRLAAALQRAFLYAPYTFHITRDTPSLSKVLGHDIASVTGNILIPLLHGVSRGSLVLALLALLAVQSPTVAVGAFVTLGAAYSLVYRLTKRRQSQLGQRASRAEYEARRTSQEALGGIKELTVLERRLTTSARYADANWKLAETAVSRKVTETVPRHLLETMTVICILVVTVVLLGQEEAGAVSAIPTLTLYVFVGYRLMPSLQQLYSTAMSIRYGMPALQSLLADWKETGAGAPLQTVSQTTPLQFSDSISVQDVTFTYPGAARPALDRVALDLRRGESIGLIGRTGAGKSTLADILLGLLEPDAGSVTIDGAPLNRTSVPAWRQQIGYVAQHIFLANGSVSENIAFGLPLEEIDEHAVKEAARLAQIDEFISALPFGYSTTVGERGVRLSGGERQRVGIARALYRRPSVLIFDEATSALDGLTEEAVMDAIRRLSGDRTVVLVAHRLRTLDACDRLVLLEAGRVIAIGSPADLDATSEEFRRFRGRS